VDGAEKRDTAQRSLVFVAVAVAVVVVLVFLWYAVDVVLLAFLGILLAILLRAPADWLAKKTGLAPGWCLAMVGLALLTVLFFSSIVFGKGIVAESLRLIDRVPEIVESAKERVREGGFGNIFEKLESSGALDTGGSQFIGRGLGLIGSTFGAIANVLIVIFFAAFLAAQPRLYLDGFLYLVAKRKRARVEEVMLEIGQVLRRWLVGQAFLASVVGVATGAGLALVGVPFALPLGVLAGVMEFVPYIGPFIAFVPALLVAFAEGPQVGLWAVGVLVVIQSLESYVLSPLVQHKSVYLPPAAVLFAQVVMGVVVGALGVAVATPLAATLLIAMNMLYVQDVLGDKSAGIGS
jgi:predicted PurR-regulated permease PerM